MQSEISQKAEHKVASLDHDTALVLFCHVPLTLLRLGTCMRTRVVVHCQGGYRGVKGSVQNFHDVALRCGGNAPNCLDTGKSWSNILVHHFTPGQMHCAFPERVQGSRGFNLEFTLCAFLRAMPQVFVDTGKSWGQLLMRLGDSFLPLGKCMRTCVVVHSPGGVQGSQGFKLDLPLCT